MRWVDAFFERAYALVCSLGVAALGASACASTDSISNEQSEAVSATTEAIFTAPGGFYSTAPSFATCAISGPFAAPTVNCHNGYSMNSTGGTNTGTRLSVGQYRIFMPGMPGGGNVQAATVGSNNHCNFVGTNVVAGGFDINVLCRTPTGVLTDARFIVSYYRDTNVGGPLGAYAQSQGLIAPTLTNVWNSSGGGATVTQLGTGSYRVVFPGQASPNDTALVSSAGALAGHCKLGSWLNSGTGVAVNVLCFDFFGSPQNNQFSVSYGRNIRGEPRNSLPTGTQGAFALVNANATINPAFSRNTCAAGVNSVTTFQPAVYQEKFHAVTGFIGERPIAAFTTAIGPTGSYCTLKMNPVQGVMSDSTVIVNCFSPDGQTPTPTQHTTMMFIQDASAC
jgi:hypothetical protein